MAKIPVRQLMASSVVDLREDEYVDNYDPDFRRSQSCPQNRTRQHLMGTASIDVAVSSFDGLLAFLTVHLVSLQFRGAHHSGALGVCR